jgi:hypothetical protein
MTARIAQWMQKPCPTISSVAGRAVYFYSPPTGCSSQPTEQTLSSCSSSCWKRLFGQVTALFRWTTRHEGLQLCHKLLEIHHEHSSVGIVNRLWAVPPSNHGSIPERGKILFFCPLQPDRLLFIA